MGDDCRRPAGGNLPKARGTRADGGRQRVWGRADGCVQRAGRRPPQEQVARPLIAPVQRARVLMVCSASCGRSFGAGKCAAATIAACACGNARTAGSTAVADLAAGSMCCGTNATSMRRTAAACLPVGCAVVLLLTSYCRAPQGGGDTVVAKVIPGKPGVVEIAAIEVCDKCSGVTLIYADVCGGKPGDLSRGTATGTQGCREEANGGYG